MARRLREHLLPEVQRRTLDELTAELELVSGDARSKLSAFWTMLTLSAVIATAGVLADSTATVIGAMIIAPLSTPIMGFALGLVKRRGSWSLLLVILGSALVVLVGAGFSRFLPGGFDPLANSQIAGRTSPGMLDLVAALATGLAGAVALARRDVAAVLPGVAIAISLVPPLAVVGVCLGVGERQLALGALLLFLSNLIALVLSGTLVFAVLGYSGDAATQAVGSRRRANVALGALLVVVLFPLSINTLVSYFLTTWTEEVRVAAEEWIAAVPDASVTGVEVVSLSFHVEVLTPGDVPPPGDLVDALDGKVPDGLEIVVVTTHGEEIAAGTVGD